MSNKFIIFYETNVHCFFNLFFHKTIPWADLCFYIAITAPKMMRGQLAWGANCRGIADLHRYLLFDVVTTSIDIHPPWSSLAF